MARQQQSPENAATDPYFISETVCDGPFNIYFGKGRATITFTHERAKAGPLLGNGTIETENVVRARIVFSTGHLIGLKNLLNNLIPDHSLPKDKNDFVGGGTSLH
jgi:hypothetical protein